MTATTGPGPGAVPGNAPGPGRPRVILNASAGSKAGIATNETVAAHDIEALFAAVGSEVDVLATGSAEESAAAARAAVADGCAVVVAAGGDGTFGIVARSLLEAAAAQPGDAQPALGLLPLGSAMNVARSLGIPRDLAAAAVIVAEGHTRPMDVGVLGDGSLFFEALAIGLHAELFAEAAAFDDGDLAAPIRAAWTAVRYCPSRVTLELDDRAIATRALVISVSNGPYTGIGFTVAPDARLDDGRFDIRVFERFSRLDLLLHFGSIALGRRRYEPRVRTFRSRRVAVTSTSPLPVGIDGEETGATPVEATVRHGALRVLVPQPG